jgi:hypothetical protein
MVGVGRLAAVGQITGGQGRRRRVGDAEGPGPGDQRRGGKVALLSEEVTVSAMVLTTFQLGSTALTVTLNFLGRLRTGRAVLPLAVPGAAVSPGTSNWSLLNRTDAERRAYRIAQARAGGVVVW